MEDLSQVRFTGRDHGGSCKSAVANGYRDIRLKPEAGLLVMFPHWLEHFVEVHESETSRISIPFNVIK